MNMQKNKNLQTYLKKRNFSSTSEPYAVLRSKKSGDFVVHLHDARRKHYDLRLQWKGVLKCWAIPKGPSLHPKDKRLAVRTEDHPDEYKSFEGVIPKGNYGAGPTLIWDAGEFLPLNDFELGLKKGHIGLYFDGVKLKGKWSLIKMKGDKKENWLLVKERDEFTSNLDVTVNDASVATGRELSDLSKSTASPVPDEKMPQNISPQLAVLRERIPDGNWALERKYDGYRLLAFINSNQVRLITRNGKDWTEKFSAIKHSLENGPLQNVILDGEVVAFDEIGRTDFEKLINFENEKNADLTFVIFDLLHMGGKNLRNLPFLQRRRILERLFEKADSIEHVELSEVLKESKNPIELACRKSWEGIIAKEHSSIYHEYRHQSWVKIKCENRNEYVIIGVTNPRGNRAYFGSLLLAENMEGHLVYRGRVGTGFSEAKLKSLYQTLSQYNTKEPPPVEDLDETDIKTWIKPHFFAEVTFSEQTSSGLLRQPAFLGIRKDKTFSPDDSTEITHPHKLLYKQDGITKLDLWNYYSKIFPDFKKWSGFHPLSLVRCPEGYENKCFFQKHLGPNITRPRQIKINEKKKAGKYAYIAEPADLKALVQLGVLEFHTWNCTVRAIQMPIYVVFDLDPGPGLNFDSVIRGARFVRKALKSFGKTSYVRTSGGKGLHVLTNIQGMSWEEAFKFSKYLAAHLVNQHPDFFIDKMSKKLRKGKIFIDYFRNRRGATSIGNYSTRAKLDVPVATPLSWRELKIGMDPTKFNINSVPKRLKTQKRDPWQSFYKELSSFRPR